VAPFLREMYLERIVGVSKDEIEASILAAKDVRRKRKETVRKMKNDKLEMVIESLQRKTARFFGAKTLYPFPRTSSTSVARSLPTESRDRTSFQDSNNKKKEAVESPRQRGRRSPLRFGKSGSGGGSCPDLSASTHPIPSSGVNHRRIVSLDS
jgi:chromatin remodeling complex protein RSC6